MKIFTLKSLGVWLACIAAVLIYLSYGTNWFDGRLYYSRWDAIGYLAILPPEWLLRLKAFSLVDFFLFIPAYFIFGWKLWNRLAVKSMWPLLLLCIGTAADCMETLCGFLLLHEIGWESGPLTNILSLSTPIKWGALLLGLLFYFRDFFRSKRKLFS